ncbi:CinA family protein [Pseudobdellovibrio exovorus]|uniref:CinA-like protein n=1 Tax=Pseudobdellovibrio exovorus JSS TaxID=1184267 RepID=M4V8I5_9BACT|nr:CinA family protein [Pseudobdellovibrio exovorus]AGH94775.1 CinA-like protein [Pseudobdellovibrio exovorus JSS]
MKTNAVKSKSELQNTLQSSVVGTVRVLRDNGLTVGFAESCTGGLLSSSFTELAGVSDVFTGSIISYDNSVKKQLLQVSEETLQTRGAVSSETAHQMAEGALRSLGVSIAVSVTGIAGPSGGTAEKPVGTVFIAIAGSGREEMETHVRQYLFAGDRKEVQLQTCIEAIKFLNEFINKK